MLLVTPEWQQAVSRWRRLPEAERVRYWESLSSAQQAQFQAIDAVLPTSIQPVASSTVNGEGTVICPNANCGYQGVPRREPRGNTGIGCLLLFFFLVPGILYFMFRSGYRYVCPRCGVQIRTEN